MADAWSAIVGVPLDDWMRADSTEQVDWLTWLRDHPMATPPLAEYGDTVGIYDFGGRLIKTVRC